VPHVQGGFPHDLLNIDTIVKGIQNKKIYKIIKDWTDVKIVLIQKVGVQNKEELDAKEDKFIIKSINDPFCLNTYRAHLTELEKKQYKKDYRDKPKYQNRRKEYEKQPHRKEYQKEYQRQEKYRNYRKEYEKQPKYKECKNQKIVRVAKQ